MNRTDEFISLLSVCGYQHWQKKEENEMILPTSISSSSSSSLSSNPSLPSPSLFSSLATNLSISIKQNELLLKRVEKLYVSN